MTLADRLRSIATAPADADLAAALGVRPDEITLGPGVLVVGGETISLAEAHRALTPPAGDPGPPARVRIEDLWPTSSDS